MNISINDWLKPKLMERKKKKKKNDDNEKFRSH